MHPTFNSPSFKISNSIKKQAGLLSNCEICHAYDISSISRERYGSDLDGWVNILVGRIERINELVLDLDQRGITHLIEYTEEYLNRSVVNDFCYSVSYNGKLIARSEQFTKVADLEYVALKTTKHFLNQALFELKSISPDQHIGCIIWFANPTASTWEREVGELLDESEQFPHYLPPSGIIPAIVPVAIAAAKVVVAVSALVDAANGRNNNNNNGGYQSRLFLNGNGNLPEEPSLRDIIGYRSN